jgi:hypothetical protein
MMEAAGHGRLDDSAFVKALHPSWLRGVLRQGEVCAGPVVVDDILAQQAAQMGFVQHHDVVEALPAEGADEPLVGEQRPGVVRGRDSRYVAWIKVCHSRQGDPRQDRWTPISSKAAMVENSLVASWGSGQLDSLAATRFAARLI